MRKPIPLPNQPAPSAASEKAFPRGAKNPLAIPAAALAAVLGCATMLSADQPPAKQTPAAHPAAKPAVKPAAKPAHTRKRPRAAKPVTPPAPVAVAAPAPPPAPELPKWPANERPSQASVTWDSQGLRVEADNASLRQILNDFSTASGAKVQGLTTDQRVFGVYGPGPARDVITVLLEGSGYNVLMIGDQGQGTPRQIVLTSRQAGGGQPAAANFPSAPNPAEEEPEVEEPQPVQPPQPTTPGHMPRVPHMPPQGGNPPDQPN